ncbi:MAG: hypothetical protein U9R79_19595 [Armatimonadota bacterium]|nr:hypothetical protein [Armatimonadota bacterium]
MSERPGRPRTARGDAEIIIAPDGEVIIFDLDRRLLRAAETLNPADPRLKAAREALDHASGDADAGD